MITKPFAYLSAALFIIILVLGWFTYSYRDELRDLTVEYATTSANAATCKAMLAEQNLAIEKLRKEKVKPEVITTIKYVDKLKIKYVDRNITRKECNEVISTIDAIRSRYP